MFQQTAFQTTLEKFSKLLAQENLRVVFSAGLQTAMCDVKNRTLYLPVWAGVSEELMDMLTGHEVSHAIHTPQNLHARANALFIPNHFLQVVEDCRIDLALQREYPGFKRSYRIGTKELLDRDFFGIKNKNLEELSLIDRLNLHCKGGRYDNLVVPFTEAEAKLVAEADELITPEDTLVLAKKLADLDHQQENRQQKADKTVRGGKVRDKEEVEREDEGDYGQGEEEKEEEQNQNGSPETDNQEDEIQGESSDDGEDSDTNEDVDSGECSGNEEETEDSDDDTKDEGEDKESDVDSSGDTPENNSETNESGNDDTTEEDSVNERPQSDISETMNELEKKLATSVTDKAPSTVYLPNYLSEIQDFSTFLAQYSINTKGKMSVGEATTRVMNVYHEQTKGQVQMLVNRFKQKHAADEFRRTRISRSGNLDPNRLHAFKTSDDLFLRSEIKPDGQNHGLVMVVDGSGSMSDIFAETMIQVFALTEFCQKMNIPYEVYMFKDDSGMARGGSHRSKDGSFVWNGNFRHVNILSSRMKKSEREKALTGFALSFPSVLFSELTRQGIDVQVSYGVNRSPFSLNTTPLAKSIYSATDLITQFQKRNRVQKVHLVVLTDGQNTDSYISLYGAPDHTGNRKLAGTLDTSSTEFVDELNSKSLGSLSSKSIGGETTRFAVNVFKKRHPNVNVIGFYLSKDHEFQYGEPLDKRESAETQFRINRYYETKAFDMDRYFVVNCNSMKIEDKIAKVKDIDMTDTDMLSACLSLDVGQHRKRSAFLNTFIDLIV